MPRAFSIRRTKLFGPRPRHWPCHSISIRFVKGGDVLLSGAFVVARDCTPPRHGVTCSRWDRVKHRSRAFSRLVCTRSEAQRSPPPRQVWRRTDSSESLDSATGNFPGSGGNGRQQFLGKAPISPDSTISRRTASAAHLISTCPLYLYLQSWCVIPVQMPQSLSFMSTPSVMRCCIDPKHACWTSGIYPRGHGSCPRGAYQRNMSRVTVKVSVKII